MTSSRNLRDRREPIPGPDNSGGAGGHEYYTEASVRMAEQRWRGRVHLPAPIPAERTRPAGRPKVPLRAASLAIALPPPQSEGATA